MIYCHEFPLSFAALKIDIVEHDGESDLHEVFCLYYSLVSQNMTIKHYLLGISFWAVSGALAKPA